MVLAGIQTPFVLVGGVATALYMPRRLTFDLDILVLPDDAARCYQELQELGYSEQDQGQLALAETIWRGPDGSSLDVLEATEPWGPAAVSTPNRSPTGDPVIALPYLVLMKLAASRPQDLADLSRMLGVADEPTLQHVRAAVRRYRAEDSADLESLIALGRLELAVEDEPSNVEG